MRSLISMFVRGEFLEIPTPNPNDTRWASGRSMQERLEALQARWVLITHNAAHAFSVPVGTEVLFRGYIPPDGAIDNDMNLVDTLTPQQWADVMSTAYHLPAGAY